MWRFGGSSDKRLAELLVKKNDVQQVDMDNVLRIPHSIGGQLGALLLRTGAISEDLLLKRLSELWGEFIYMIVKHFRKAMKYSGLFRSHRSGGMVFLITAY